MNFRKSMPLVLAGSVVMCSKLAHAATIYVKAGMTGGNGQLWTTAYGDLQTALAAASEGDEIWVAAGTYKPGTNRTDSFVMRRRVKLYGGFEGVVSETALSHRKPDVHLTILSGDIDNDGLLDADNSIHVVHAESAGIDELEIDRDTQLDGFIITMGYADGAGPIDGFGGGMIIAYASPVIQNCVFIKNHCASTGGGGAHITGRFQLMTPERPHSNPSFRSCRFLNNTSEGEGGGLCNQYDDVEIINCVFSGNVADGSGGGLYNADADATMTVINCTFYANSASIGGGIHTSGGTSALVIRNSIFWSNVNGHITNSGATPTVSNSNVGAFDPLFADVDGPDNVAHNLDDRLWLSCGSASIDAGDQGDVPQDTYDVDNDGVTTGGGWRTDSDRAAAAARETIRR